MIEQMGAYLHIPFCMSKCNYCDFVSFPDSKEYYAPYVDALCKEIALTGETTDARRASLSSIYFGGGTPSILPSMQIQQLMDAMTYHFKVLPDAEITLELNPGSISVDDLKCICNTGVNRVSVGVQSLSDEILKVLGRAHTAEDATLMIDRVMQFGIKNVSSDVMIGLPGQTLEIAIETVEVLIQKQVEHISVYSLSIEPDTPFEKLYKDKMEHLMPQKLERQMYWAITDLLKSKGYVHYEISNYAKPGFESQHNMNYWKGKGYFGFGCAAHGYINHLRYSNTEDVIKYIHAASHLDEMLDNIRKPEEQIDKNEAMKEFFLLGFRMLDGVNEKDFIRQFGPMNDSFKMVLSELVCSGLIIQDKYNYRLSHKGLDFANEVFREFI